MMNEADTEADAKTTDKAETGVDAKMEEEVGGRTSRRGTRWTGRWWAAPAGDGRGGENMRRVQWRYVPKKRSHRHRTQ